jgi:hypothetical protein
VITGIAVVITGITIVITRIAIVVTKRITLGTAEAGASELSELQDASCDERVVRCPEVFRGGVGARRAELVEPRAWNSCVTLLRSVM